MAVESNLGCKTSITQAANKIDGMVALATASLEAVRQLRNPFEILWAVYSHARTGGGESADAETAGGDSLASGEYPFYGFRALPYRSGPPISPREGSRIVKAERTKDHSLHLFQT